MDLYTRRASLHCISSLELLGFLAALIFLFCFFNVFPYLFVCAGMQVSLVTCIWFICQHLPLLSAYQGGIWHNLFNTATLSFFLHFLANDFFFFFLMKHYCFTLNTLSSNSKQCTLHKILSDVHNVSTFCIKKRVGHGGLFGFRKYCMELLKKEEKVFILMKMYVHVSTTIVSNSTGKLL